MHTIMRHIRVSPLLKNKRHRRFVDVLANTKFNSIGNMQTYVSRYLREQFRQMGAVISTPWRLPNGSFPWIYLADFGDKEAYHILVIDIDHEEERHRRDHGLMTPRGRSR